MENEQVEQVEYVKLETIKMEETRKQPSKLEGPGGAPLGEVIGAVITVGVLGFWFGGGATLGAKVVNNLEELKITKEPQRVMKEQQGETAQVQRVFTKNQKKVEAGKKLAESNRKKREVKKREQAKLEASGVNQYYGIGAVISLGVIGSLGYYIYRSKKVEQPKQNNPKPHPQTQAQTNTFEMDEFILLIYSIKSFLYYKNGQEEYSK